MPKSRDDLQRESASLIRQSEALVKHADELKRTAAEIGRDVKAMIASKPTAQSQIAPDAEAALARLDAMPRRAGRFSARHLLRHDDVL